MKVYILEYMQDPGYDCGLDSIIIGVYSTIELAQEKQKKYKNSIKEMKSLISK